MKALAAIPIALMLAAPSQQRIYTYEHDAAAIVKVYCKRASGAVYGTAFKVTERAYITARHVVHGGECFVGGKPITVTSEDAPSDYATFIGPKSNAVIKVRCSAPIEREIFIARGYPGGSARNFYLPWLATAAVMRGFEPFGVFIGEAYPGMSGGPVIDKRGRVIGVVSKRLPTQATIMKETGYCK